MTQPTPTPHQRRRGRIFPQIQWSPEEKARRKAIDEAFSQRCRAIFERVHPDLIEEHYGWYIAIEPDSGDYFIDIDKNVAHQKARRNHPNSVHCVFCLNETGATGRI
ncbi:MAG: hypothetical protein MUD14_21765 [Hydrococcus sp. Prado102]|jgi:hypothetical protein|nr:hypothetical protein [Hydrococcus sp. Prado102]